MRRKKLVVDRRKSHSGGKNSRHLNELKLDELLMDALAAAVVVVVTLTDVPDVVVVALAVVVGVGGVAVALSRNRSNWTMSIALKQGRSGSRYDVEIAKSWYHVEADAVF